MSEMPPEQMTQSRREELIAAVERVGIPEAVRRIESVVQKPPELTTENLEPCPFCGSTGRLRLARDDAGYFVLCAFHPLEPSCGAQSGYQNTRDLAIRAWNTRHGR